MRTTLTVAGVALAGTALGALTYTAVSAPPAGVADAVPVSSTSKPANTCTKPDRLIDGICTTVVHRRLASSNQAGTAQAASAAAPAPATAVQPSASATPVADDHESHGDDDEAGYPETEAETEAEDRTEDRD